MEIIINPRQFKLLEDYVAAPELKDRIKSVENAKKELGNYIEKSGEYMEDITNGKTYLVQYLKALSDLVGMDYAVCTPVRKNGTYGAFYVKPYATFKKKISIGKGIQTGVQMKRKPNLYQQMGWNN